ncbi:hypothetical protein M2160_001179 [Streptomyces sp. SAI-117]|uniref:hypothetical protein n=1 Tax=unclassified Streptomyces TaxID=2593676 RepID=UPI0024753DE3|nr:MULTISPECIES: hypothetical protein [unclassified Streptomyces]MDH6547046.1 hypothetical protein [Streptomyces sp. SAI-041]MDH6566158.1 hypothetical protein [Streptomyces sp. SAI-117]
MRHIDEPVVDTGSAPDGQPPKTLERRMRALEEQIDILTLAVRALVEGLERAPGLPGGGGRAAKGADIAHDILRSRDRTSPRAGRSYHHGPAGTDS